MDRTTVDALDAMAHPGAAFLLELLAGPATESELVDRVRGGSQPTANRRLARLETLGLVVRDAGTKHGPGRPWRLVHPKETESLLSAAVELGEVLAEQDRLRREAAKRRLRRSRAERQGLRAVPRSRPGG